jgi:phosphopantetheine--protein transferase-like protein
MLRIICETEGIALGESELSLPGLDLIELFFNRYNIGLSIAHCRGMLAVALGPGRVGVDCELKGRSRNWQGIAQQFFTPSEAHTISVAKPDEREKAFLRHWVLKEAYIKAIHGSIFGDLNRLVVEGQGVSIMASECNTRNKWWTWEVELSGSMIALCSSHSGAVVFSVIDSLSSESAAPVVSRLSDNQGQLASLLSP